MVFDRLILRYYCLLCVVTILFVKVTSQDYGLVHFSKNTEELIECVENYISFNHIRSDQSDLEIKAIIKFVAREFQQNTKVRRRVRSEVTSLINTALQFLFLRRLREPAFRLEVSDALMHALLDCSDPAHVSEDINNQALPYFLNEPVNIGLLLDYALVNWPYPMENMINSARRRALLRRFAEEALDILECVYSSVVPSTFRYVLRIFWRQRAYLFYDVELPRIPYIDHIYTQEHPFPHTHGDTSVFVNLMTEDFAQRSPRIEEAALNQILSLHRPNTPDPHFHFDRSDVFYRYERNGMSTADHYFEFHLSRLYRIMFIFMELLERGVRADNDHYEGASFDAILSRDIQAILYDDNAYREYLHRRRVHELSRNDNINVYRRNLETSRTLHEEDLIMLFWIRVRNCIRADSPHTTTTTTTTTTSSPTTTSASTSSRKYTEVGRVFRNSFRAKVGKYFPVERIGKYMEKFGNMQISDYNRFSHLVDESMFASRMVVFYINSKSQSIMQESMRRSCLRIEF